MQKRKKYTSEFREEAVKLVLSHLFLSILKFPKKSYFGYYAAISNAKFSNVDKLSFAPSI